MSRATSGVEYVEPRRLPWIKMRCDLREQPEVLSIADACGVDDEDLIVGKLHRLWSYFDLNSEDGAVAELTPRRLDQLVRLDGFAAALVKVGWLETPVGAGCRIPHWSYHNSTTTKARLNAQRRAAWYRQQRIALDEHEAHRAAAAPEPARQSVTTAAGEVFTVDPASVAVQVAKAMRDMAYSDSDGAIVYQAAALVARGAVSENAFWDAVAGTKACCRGKGNHSIRYFRTLLTQRLGKPELAALLRRARMPADFVAGPPSKHEVAEYTEALARVGQPLPTKAPRAVGA